MRASLACVLAIQLTVPTLSAQKLGTLTFPNSGNAAAQAPFIKGLLLLHSFEYADAAAAFRDAQRADSAFALAYWGEALTHTHPVWNEQNVDAARAVLSRLAATPAARRARAGTARERLYMDAVEILYGAGAKETRDTLFADAMQEITRLHPGDDEALTLYALALLGLSQGVRVVPTYVRAGAIAQDVLQRNPDHPGAAHYVIHAFDDPVHAPLGLHAARAYSKIAPAAPHAQHMTTHIFLAMGMWDDVVSQNEIAAGHDHDRYRAGHYTAWLGYGYLQQGRYADARRHFETMRRNAGTPPRRGEEASLLAMRAHYLVNSERWSDSLAHWAPKAPVGPVVAAMDAFATAYAALKSGRRAQAEAGLRDLVRRGQATSVGDFFGGDSLVPVILERQLRGLLRLQDGEVDAGLALLRQAAAMEDGLAVEFGPPNVVKPSRETLGEALLALGRAAAAAREFERALQLAPGRARALLGLARSATAAGDHSLARRTAEALAAKWHAADSTLPELAEVGRLARGR